MTHLGVSRGDGKNKKKKTAAMEVQSHLDGWVSRYMNVPEKNIIALEEGSCVQDALERLELPGKMALAILVNGKTATPDTLLSDGDTIKLAPATCGG